MMRYQLAGNEDDAMPFTHGSSVLTEEEAAISWMLFWYLLWSGAVTRSEPSSYARVWTEKLTFQKDLNWLKIYFITNENTIWWWSTSVKLISGQQCGGLNAVAPSELPGSPIRSLAQHWMSYLLPVYPFRFSSFFLPPKKSDRLMWHPGCIIASHTDD